LGKETHIEQGEKWMRINYAKFVNFTGIYAGIGVKELELDFTIGKNKIIMPLGGNGAGKTTLMSILNPYRDTNDERSDSYILLDHPGEKILHLQDGEDLYVIHHLYKKVDAEGKATGHNKSFISKNGVELNENGGIKTFEAALVEEFNLTRDYFRVGRLGANVSTFIDMKTAERKKYINNFLPDIDDYLEAYNTVNEKFKKMKSNIDSIKSQLDKLDTKDNLTELETTLSDAIGNIQKEIASLEKLVDRSEVKIEGLTGSLEIGEGEDYRVFMSTLRGNISALSEKLTKEKATLAAYFDKYPQLKDFDDDRINEAVLEYNKEIITAQSNMKQLTASIDELEKNIVRLRNEKAGKENILKNEVNVDRLEEQLTDRRVTAEDYRQEISRSEFAGTEMTVQEAATHYAMMQGNISKLEGVQAKYNSSVIEEFDVKYFSTMEGHLSQIQGEHSIMVQKKKETDDTISRIESNSYLLDTLEQRPAACVIDTCPFIVKALEYKNQDHSRLEELYAESQSLEKEIASYEKEIEACTDIVNLMNDIRDLQKHLSSPFLEEFIQADLDVEDVTKLVKMDIMKIQEYFDISELTRVVNLKVDLANELERIEKLESHLELAMSQQAIIVQAREELADIESQIDESNAKIRELTLDLGEQEKTIKQNNTRLQIVTTIKTLRKESAETEGVLAVQTEELKKREDTAAAIGKEEEQLASYRSAIIMKEKELKPLSEKLKQTQRDLVIIDDCITRLAEVEQHFGTYKMIKDSLDPKKGIPLFFIDNYLKDIAVRANELLDTAYDGQFKIKFDISASDFLINVFKSDGTFLQDINKASQGETSLTTVSLSLGMIERMMTSTKYNVLYLDEVDSTLSTKNRRLFITLLEDQMEKLGIEQVFIISHNNEFDSHPVDMILLKENNVDTDDKEFMQNKSVIFQYAQPQAV
jgi:DNA repair exonuclease SbcCD ATPase subunit